MAPLFEREYMTNYLQYPLKREIPNLFRMLTFGRHLCKIFITLLYSRFRPIEMKIMRKP